MKTDTIPVDTKVSYRGKVYVVAYPNEGDELLGILPYPPTLLTVVRWVDARKVKVVA